jgi:phosphatidylethanolamine/phosphatidyl-N-methylethanolamine N-methyltransferase
MTAMLRSAGALRSDTIRTAYARLARYYDVAFGPALAPARATAVRTINALPGTEVLEVGVGTGLALPQYAPQKRITGIDVSADMLAKAQNRIARQRLSNVRALYEMDAQSTGFAKGQFDIAIAMFVASVVPDPRALLGEMRRIVKPGGTLLFVNHFAGDRAWPAWWRQRSGALTAKLGWRAEFRLEDMFDAADLHVATRVPQWPLGFFQLIALPQPV